MKQYLKKILNNCDEVTMHTVKEDLPELSLRQYLEYKIHIIFCRCCKNFRRQNEKINRSIGAMVEQLDQQAPYVMPEEFKEQLKQKMK